MTIKSSLVVPQQLPSYIREGISGNRITQNQITPYNEDYQTFVSFLQAYYEFLESSGNVYAETKNIISYKDIDRTLSQFEQYFFNEFLQYFPEESLTDKKFLTKFAKELYERKGTPSSIKFLFRALFNSDCELYNTRESVLIASGGKWVRSKFVRVNSLDPRFLSLQNYKLFGETSKSIGRIQRAQVSGNRTEIFLSDIIREFNSGEIVTVVDDNLNPILFDSQKLSAKVIGVVSKVEINPNFRGLLYNPGDPAIIVGGLNPDSDSPKSAIVEVGETTKGSVTNVTLKNGSNGFRTYPNTIISFSGGGGGFGANAIVSSVDTTKLAKINFIANDVISLYANTTLDANSYGFVANPTANANTQLKNAFSFIDIDTFPISEIELISRGINYLSVPKIEVDSYIDLGYDRLNVKELGVLSPPTILFGGFNYSNGDVVVISGGSGFGAYANVKSVNANGSIESIQYQYKEEDLYPLGGAFYRNDSLPTISVQSTNNKIISLTNIEEISSGNSVIKVSSVANLFAGMYISGNGIATTSSGSKPFGYYSTNTTILFVDSSNNQIIISNPLTANVSNSDVFVAEGSAVSIITSILGDGEDLSIEIDNVGSIKNFNIIDQGEDYISNPSVVLKVLDVVVINVNGTNLPVLGEVLYQGSASSPTFTGFVYSIQKISGQIQETYFIRVYSYNGILDSSNLYIDRNGVDSRTLSFTPLTTYNQDNFVSGKKIYGNGSARANAEFINGTILLQGKYQTEDGFLSSQSVLQSEVFNNYTYSLTVEKEFQKYKQLLYKILHPAGKKISPRNAVKSNNSLELFGGSDHHKLIELKYLTYPTVYGVFVEPNKLQIYDLNKDITGTYLSAVLTTNSYIMLTSTNLEKFYSKIDRIDDANDVIYFTDYNILNYANIAYGYSNGNNVIVTRLTSNYDIVNNGEYYTENYLREMIYDNDSILISNNYTARINTIDYENRIIYANTALNPSGNANTPSLITITRNFVANSILIDYRLEYNYIVASGNTVTGISIDGFYVVDENDKLIYVLTEI